jgi:regulation of enolase protein 1 (concanavalin A-like superfamily)
MSQLTISTLPFSLRSEGKPAARPPHVSDGEIDLVASARSDLFLDPRGSAEAPDVERFVANVSGNFQLSAHVRVEFKQSSDAGALLGYIDEFTWFKICAELDPVGTPRVVSVVTRNGASDDCNGWAIPTSGQFLRIARLGQAYALHASDDGVSWELVRFFALDIPTDRAIKVGLLAQSPAGDGTSAVFTDVKFNTNTLLDVRDGS